MAQEEKTREDRLRDTFNEHFSYERLTVGDIIRFGMFCMDECAKHNLYANHTKLWVPSLLPKHGVRVELIGQGEAGFVPISERVGIKRAFIRCNGTYFKDREGISFNDGGFISFARWADSKNVKPFYAAFQRWMREMMLDGRGA